jgi:GNAT superfamily N-acetyltransferase
MRIPGLELCRTVEFRVDAATARGVCDQHDSESTVPDHVSIVRFEPALVAKVARARSDDVADAFMRLHGAGESGWLAIDESGQVISHCWRLDNGAKDVVKRQVAIPAGHSWLHYEWTVPAWRGRGIQPMLLSVSIREALSQVTRSVQGFVTDIAPGNRASQRCSAKVGFVAASLVTSLRIYRQWFVLHRGPVPEDIVEQGCGQLDRP